MMKKKIYTSLLILGLITIAGFYYFRPQTISIGFAAGLSGRKSQLGVQVRNGFLLAVEDLNQNGGINGREIVPIIMDDQSDNDRGKEIVQKLKKDNIHYLIGFALSIMTPTVEAYANDPELLMISPTISTNHLTGKDDHFFRVCNASTEEARSLIKMLDQDGFQTIAIVRDSSNKNYTGPTHNVVLNMLKERNISVTFDESFNGPTANFDQLAKKLHQSNARQIVILASGVDTAEIAQRLRIKGNTSLLYANAWATTDDLLKNGGKAVDGMRVVGLFDISSTQKAYLDFQQKMLKAYGNSPTFPQIFGYESLLILAQAMEKADSFKIPKVKKALLDIKTFQGLQQPITLTAEGDIRRDYFTYIVKDGQFQSLKH